MLPDIRTQNRPEPLGDRVVGAIEAPRIYILHGTVAGDAASRAGHFARILDLGFDWMCWSPAPTAARDADALIAVAAEAREAGLKPMLETGPDTADDLLRVREMEFMGMLATRAATRPASDWKRAIAALRDRGDDVVLVADALGHPWEEVLATARAGFDFLLNSAAWWDLKQPWFLRQQHDLAAIVPTLASPEPLHEGRLAHRLTHVDLAHRQAIYISRYRLAAFASSGIICPMGFELGAGQMFDGAAARPSDWDFACKQAPFDLSQPIARINALKKETRVLAGEGDLRLGSSQGASVLALVRRMSNEVAVLIVNTTAQERPAPPLAELAIAAGSARFHDPLHDNGIPPDGLAPFETRLVLAETVRDARSRPSKRESESRLKALAANRVVLERATPELDGGRFPIKRAVGDTLRVEADIFCDGHEVIDAAIVYQPPGEKAWREAPMRFIDNDRWAGTFALTGMGRWTYSILAWRDLFATWRQDVAKKHDAGQSIALELTEGRALIDRYGECAKGAVKRGIDMLKQKLDGIRDEGETLGLMQSEAVAALMRRAGLRTNLSRYEHDLEVTVDRPLAACAAWYEMMPRSQSGDVRRHGTFDDVIARLPYVRDLGFDVLYFPPIHPIGTTHRKGRNNSLTAGADDPGSPYAIGASDGGHDAIHRELGDFADFERLVEAAHAHGLEIALDFAIQCSPDHPWIKQHPEWFDWRPDGSIKYAENPPKKYEDIVNVHFYRDALPSLWFQLRDVVRFWIGKGVKIFRVDNPHTKPVPFWEWMIRDIQQEHPDAIFLSEAFTRPKMMRRLAKVGFTQSYSYFTWRNTKAELTEYLTELTRGESADYMRPNFFTNTPDINPIPLQTSGRAGFQARLVLAATLNPLYGIYNGFELCDAAPIPGKEEYLNSEKYEIRAWDWGRPGNIKADVRLVNRIRRENPALWRFANLTFLNAWNDNILAYYKLSTARDNLIVVAVNLDPHVAHGAAFEAPIWEFGLPDSAAVEVVDLVEERRLTWHGKMQHVWLDPAHRPYVIWRLVPPGAA